MSFKIISDLGADIPLNLISSNDVVIINQSVELDGKECVYKHGDSTEMAEFYNDLENAQLCKTRAMNYDEIYAIVSKEAQKNDVLCFSFSQRLSATGGQMQKVCEDLNGKPNEVCYCDTETASLGQGVLVYIAVKCREQGLTLKKTVDYINAVKPRLRCYLVLDKCNNFFKGGRAENVNEAEKGYAVLILPLKNLYKKVANFLTREMAVKFVLNKLEREEAEILFVGHGNNIEEAERVVNACGKGLTSGCAYANAVMGVHSGVNPLMVAYLVK